MHCTNIKMILDSIFNINNNNNYYYCYYYYVFYVGSVVKSGSYLSKHGVGNINKYSYFPHLSSEFDEIRYNISAHCGDEYSCVSSTAA